MLDPFPPPPAWLRNAIEPWAVSANLPTLPDHIHEVLFAFAFYQFIHSFLSPWLSPLLFSNNYPKFNRRTKLNWDIHVVSFVQSTAINLASLYVMFVDQERKGMAAGERVYGYTGLCGLLQALGLGYFVYDLIVSTLYINMFGVGMLFHAISAVLVFSLGFRPFLNFYSPNFLLYELSSPFLNIHWFLDKLNMTGGKAQWYNGMALLFTFFFCRLVWGTWQSVLVYMDMWYALKQTWAATASSQPGSVGITSQVFQTLNSPVEATAEMSKFSSYTAQGVPTWLVLSYVASNLTLNFLNYYWFSKMVDAVLKRFREPAPSPAAKKEEETQKLKEKKAQNAVLDAASKLEEEESSFLTSEKNTTSSVDTGLNDEMRRRKADLASKVPLPQS
ncbi:hypothetical protein AWENTII_008626 [Aspergillus wentii]